MTMIIKYISLIETIRSLNDLFGDIYDTLTSKDCVFFKNAKLFYYIKIKYPLLRYFLSRILIFKGSNAIKSSNEFMNFLSEILIVLESLVISSKQYTDINELIKDRYTIFGKEPPPLKVYVNKSNNDYLNSCKIIYHGISPHNKIFTNKMIHIDLDFDFNNAQCSMDLNIYNGIDMNKNILTKHLVIISDGSLYNEVYKIDKQIMIDDMILFSKISMMILAPFMYVIIALCSYKFEIFKG